MSTTTAELRINASQATTTLNNLNKQVGALGKSFGALRNVVGGVALGAFVRQAFLAADAIDDIAKATGFATQTVIGFGQAIAQNGGTIADAQTSLTKLSQTISEAQNGNKTAITSFNELGISLSDLAGLSDEQILKKVIAELGQIKDKGDQARLATDLLGKSAKGVDFSGVSKDLAPAIQNSARYVESNKAAADAAQNLQNIQAKLTNELLLTLKPLSELVANINVASEKFARFYKVVETVVIALAGLFVVVRIGRAIYALWRLIVAFKDEIALLGTVIKGPIEFFKKWFEWTKKVGDAIKITKREADWKKSAGMDTKDLDDQVEKLGKIGSAIENVKKFAIGAAVAIYGVIAGIVGLNREIEKTQTKIPKNARGVQDRIDRDKRLDEERKNLELLTKAYNEGKQKVDDYTASLQKELDSISQNFALQKDALQMGEKLFQIKEVTRQVTEKMADAEQRYQEMKLGLDPKNENDKKLIGYINAQIAALKGKAKAAETAGIAAVEALQKEQEKYKELGREIEAYKRQQEQSLALDNLMAELDLLGKVGQEREKLAETLQINADLQKKLVDLRVEEEELRKRFNALTEEGRKIEQDAFDASMRDIQKRRTEAQQAADAEVEINAKKWKRINDISGDALKGFQDRLIELRESLKNYDIGAAFADNIMNAIETGKFHLKTFLLEMVQMWLQQKAKLAAIDLFENIFNPIIGAVGSGLSKALLSIFGLAEGGPAKAGQPYIVGEKGPELFVPNQSGTVIPNNMASKGLGGGGVNAPITNNYITNNINALDAKSVAQLFAENRKTLLGTVRMAEKEMPYMGR